ncbi:MAG TPA: phenylalanine--tRNA ligase subunit beta [Thermoplasmatales archaeon]|nr:phenylalanine--tRNA ligase subunit beta [Thermoplasmatales archaeon]
MPVVNFEYYDLISLLGMDIEMDELIRKIPMIGVSVERVEGNEISIEVFPNRPDLLSIEGMARALRAFFGIEKGLKKYDVEPPKIKLVVDESVAEVRPFIAGAVIRNVEMTYEMVASLMEVQEKLHFSVGKNRKKMAIGVHDFDKVSPPFVYKGVKPDEIKFVPLGKEEEMDLNEILMKHEKGVEYAQLLEGHELYPIILDKNGNVLSFPPIINGQLTAVTENTRNIFIDVTGTDFRAVMDALNIISTSIAERGGKLEQVEIKGREKLLTPDLNPREMEVEAEYIKKILNIEEKGEITEALLRMGHDVSVEGEKIKVFYAAWRNDILHPIDLVEDIAIGYGYEKFEAELPKSMTFGSSFDYNRIHHTMIGLGFNEVVTLSISSPEKEFEKMEMEGEAAEIANPIAREHSILRISLLPSLLEILSKNRHNELPQQIYEVGDVVKFENGEARQKTMLAGVKIDARAGFTECKSIVEAILRNLGYKLDVEEKKHPSFIEGRCASIILNGNEIGYFGEVKPSVISNFDLEYPVIAFEIDLSLLPAK